MTDTALRWLDILAHYAGTDPLTTIGYGLGAVAVGSLAVFVAALALGR